MSSFHSVGEWFDEQFFMLKQLLYHNAALSVVVVLDIIAIIAFSPLFDSNSHVLSTFKDAMPDTASVLSAESYHMWLLVAVFIPIPSLVQALLNISNRVGDYAERVDWLASLGLSLFLFVPNVVRFVLLHYAGSLFSVQLVYSHYALLAVERAGIICCLMVHLFGHNLRYCSLSSDWCDFSIEKATVNIGLSLLIINVIQVFGNQIQALSIVAIVLTLGVCLWLILMSIGVLIPLFSAYRKSRSFSSPQNHSDCLYSLTLLCYVVANVVNSIVGLKSTLYESQMVVTVLYVNIAVSLVVGMIPSEKHKRLAAFKQEKLETRLNLIRYVSHEMRTPLNSASMGLRFLIDELGNFKPSIPSSTKSASAAMTMGALNRSDSFSSVTNLPQKSIDRKKVTNHDPSTVRISVSSIIELLDVASQIEDSCEVAVSTLDDLLTFDKLDEQKLIIEASEINPWELVSHVTKPFVINARQANIALKIHAADGVLKLLERKVVYGDSFKLGQVIRNLVSNAFKFTATVHGKIDIVVSTVVVSGRKYVRISVDDNGVGISAQNQQKLFGQYVQFDAGRLQQGKGSGLGLWISKGIVEMHHGRIGVTSLGEDRGSCFFVDLPLHRRKSQSVVSIRGQRSDRPFQQLRNLMSMSYDPDDSEFSAAAVLPHMASASGSSKSVRGLARSPTSYRSSSRRQLNSPADGSSGNSSHRLVPRSTVAENSSLRWTPQSNVHSQSDVIERGMIELSHGSDHDPSSLTSQNDNSGTNTAHSADLSQIGKPSVSAERSLPAAASIAQKSDTDGARPSSHFVLSQLWHALSTLGDRYQANELDEHMIRNHSTLKDYDRTSSEDTGHMMRSKSVTFLNQPARFWFSSSFFRSSATLDEASSHSQSQTDSRDVDVETGRPVFENQIEGARSLSLNVRDSLLPTIRETGMHSSLPDSTDPDVNDDNKHMPGLQLVHDKSAVSSGLRGQVVPMLEISNVNSLDIVSDLQVKHSSRRVFELPSVSSESESVDENVINDPTNGQRFLRAEAGSSSDSEWGSREEMPSSNNSDRVIASLTAESRDSRSIKCLLSCEYDTSGCEVAAPQKRTPLSGSVVDSIDVYDQFTDFPVRFVQRKSVSLPAPLFTQGSIKSQSGSTYTLQSESAKHGSTTESQRQKSWESGLNFLVVDDSATNRKLLVRLLRAAGHSAEEAVDGKDCIGKVLSENASGNLQFYDAVLMDDNMPRMCGSDAVYALRENGYSGLVYGVTGDVSAEARNNFLTQGANRVLHKPLKMDRLKEYLAEDLTADTTVRT